MEEAAQLTTEPVLTGGPAIGEEATFPTGLTWWRKSCFGREMRLFSISALVILACGWIRWFLDENEVIGARI